MSEKAKSIDAYINSHSDAELGKWPLEIGGHKTILPFYSERGSRFHLLYYENLISLL